MSAPHWLIRYDPDGGEPYGELCRCGIPADCAAYHDEGAREAPVHLVESTPLYPRPPGETNTASGVDLADVLANLLDGLSTHVRDGDDTRHVGITAGADGATIIGQLYSASRDVDPMDWRATVRIGAPTATSGGAGSKRVAWGVPTVPPRGEAMYAHPDDIDLDATVETVGAALADGADDGAALDALADLATEIRWLRGQRAALAAALTTGGDR
jgi:hypothetical protein